MGLNVGGADRVARMVIGTVICALGIANMSWWGLIGLIPLGTAAIGWCPPYALLGVNTGKS